jgi:predicted phage replisome organizer
MFNSSRKIKQIEVMPEGDAILVIWLKLLLLAGNINDGGAIYLTPEIPYTDEMLANELRRPINTVRLALSTFEHFGMVEIIDDILHLSSWEKYQSTDKLAEIREQNRLSQQRSRARRRQIKEAEEDSSDVSRDSHVTVTGCHATEEERDSDKELLTISLAREKNADVDNSVDGVDDDDPKDKRLEYMRGTLGEGKVFMSQAQFNYLLDNYSLDEIYHYFEVIKEQIRMGRRYRKTHFQAIIDMAEKDRKKR